jgi:hypothetical protein
MFNVMEQAHNGLLGMLGVPFVVPYQASPRAAYLGSQSPIRYNMKIKVGIFFAILNRQNIIGQNLAVFLNS